MKKKQVDPDLRRRRALAAFQVGIYGYLFILFLIQMHMLYTRDW